MGRVPFQVLQLGLADFLADHFVEAIVDSPENLQSLETRVSVSTPGFAGTAGVSGVISTA